MNRATCLVAVLVLSSCAAPGLGGPEPPKPDEVARLKERIARLEAKLAQEKKGRPPAMFGLHELLPCVNEGKLPEGLAKRLAQSKVPDTKTAKQMAFQHYFKTRGGFGANQTVRVSSLFPIAVPMEDFAEPGDLIWEARIEGFLGTSGVHQITWINASNGKIHPLLPVGRPALAPPIKNLLDRK